MRNGEKRRMPVAASGASGAAAVASMAEEEWVADKNNNKNAGKLFIPFIKLNC